MVKRVSHILAVAMEVPLLKKQLIFGASEALSINHYHTLQQGRFMIEQIKTIFASKKGHVHMKVLFDLEKNFWDSEALTWTDELPGMKNKSFLSSYVYNFSNRKLVGLIKTFRKSIKIN